MGLLDLNTYADELRTANQEITNHLTVIARLLDEILTGGAE